MGGSGCGKSTLLRHLVGLLRPAQGDVLINDTDIWHSPEAQREQELRRTGVLFQSGGLWSSMTLAENIALPLQEYTTLAPAAIAEVVSFKLALVGLAGCEGLYPAEISGGMQKRAGLARALAFDPQLLFCDEPSAGLDPISARNLDELIVTLSRSLGTTVVIVTHELASIFAIGTAAIYLDNVTHTMIAEGDPATLRDHAGPAVVRQFLQGGRFHGES
jgi:phospholipid/cholesterol/gamma-HCH transport system ATP-binding protein